MSSGDNKGIQFVITTSIFLIIFLVFYLFIRGGDEDTEETTVDFKLACINDGSIYLTDIKGEASDKGPNAIDLRWDPKDNGIYYLDKYLKLNYYDIDDGETMEVTTNVSSFAVSPGDDTDYFDFIAVVKEGDEGGIKVFLPSGEEVIDLGQGFAPNWHEGDGDGVALSFIVDGDIYTINVDRDGGTGEVEWEGPILLFDADAIDFDTSTDGRYVLYTEWDGGTSRLVLGDVTDKTIEVVGSETFEDETARSNDLGFSSPLFYHDKNEALFILNDLNGGRVSSLDAESRTTSYVSGEIETIYSLSISSDDSFFAYFFVDIKNQPDILEIVTEDGEDKEIALKMGPDVLNKDFTEALKIRADNGEIGEASGAKISVGIIDRILNSDKVRVVDHEKGVRWIAGVSGQYPHLR